MTKHLVIPDTQVKPGDSIEHLRWAGKYAVDQMPDVIVMIGDWWDMSSLSSYDKGTKSFEGRRYTKDIEAGNAAMDVFMEPILEEQDRRVKGNRKRWNPRLVFTLGNHENRIERAANNDPRLDGLVKYSDFNLGHYGWEVYPFLQPVVIDGVAYCHYFVSGVMGRPVSSAKLLLDKQHMSCVMGHVQDRSIAFARRADGRRMTGLFAGIYYQHEEEYLNPQTNGSWSGVWVLHEVEDGAFDEMPVSINYLRNKYGEGTGRLRLVS
jgi:hypothetical protein